MTSVLLVLTGSFPKYYWVRNEYDYVCPLYNWIFKFNSRAGACHLSLCLVGFSSPHNTLHKLKYMKVIYVKGSTDSKSLICLATQWFSIHPEYESNVNNTRQGCPVDERSFQMKIHHLFRQNFHSFWRKIFIMTFFEMENAPYFDNVVSRKKFMEIFTAL